MYDIHDIVIQQFKSMGGRRLVWAKMSFTEFWS